MNSSTQWRLSRRGFVCTGVAAACALAAGCRGAPVAVVDPSGIDITPPIKTMSFGVGSFPDYGAAKRR